MRISKRHWFALPLALHFLICLWRFHSLDLQNHLPVTNLDYFLTYLRTATSIRFFEHSHRFWGYDPYDMAGYVLAPLRDGDCSLVNVLCWSVSGLCPVWISLLAIEILGFAIAPFLILLSVRNFGGTTRGSWIAFSTAVIMYGFYEPFSRKCAAAGLFGYQMACFASVWSASLLWKYLRDRRFLSWFVFTLTVSAAWQLNPVSLIVLIAPLVAICIAHKDAFKGMAGIAVAATIAVCVATNWYWLRPSIAFRDWNGFLSSWRSNVYGANPWGLFVPLRLGYDSIVGALLNDLLLGGVIWLGVKNSKNWSPGKTFTFIFWSTALFVAAAAGPHIPGVREILPDRFLLPLGLVLDTAAGFWIESFVADHWELTRTFGLALIPIAALYPAASLFGLTNLPTLGNDLTADQRRLISYLSQRDCSGRILVEENFVSVQPRFIDALARLTDHPVIGSTNSSSPLISDFTIFSGRIYADGVPVDQSQAFNRPLASFSEKEFASYLDLYNVEVIAASSDRSNLIFQRFSSTLEPEASTISEQDTLAGHFRVFRVRTQSGWLAQGTGSVTADYDKIKIDHAGAGTLILKFHYLKTLQTAPALQIKPVKLLDDPVPFIEIDNRTAEKSILIYNRGL